MRPSLRAIDTEKMGLKSHTDSDMLFRHGVGHFR